MSEEELVHVLNGVDSVVSPRRPCEIERVQCPLQHRIGVGAQERHEVVILGTENRLVQRPLSQRDSEQRLAYRRLGGCRERLRDDAGCGHNAEKFAPGDRYRHPSSPCLPAS